MQVRALSLLYNGNLDLAEKHLGTALEHLPDEPLVISLQAIVHARCNRTGRALECVRRALDSPRSFGHTHHTYYQIACVFAVLGDTQKAMAWLDRTADTGFPCWPFFKLDPHLENESEVSTGPEITAVASASPAPAAKVYTPTVAGTRLGLPLEALHLHAMHVDRRRSCRSR